MIEQQFPRIMFEDITNIEKCFNVKSLIYNLNSNGTLSHVYKTMSQSSSKMYLNVYSNHYSYITNFQKFAKKFQCKKCSKIFKKIWHLKRHNAICYKRTKYIFPGGSHKTKPTIFDKLESVGINISRNQKYFPYYIVWDMEAMLQKIQPSTQDKLKWLTKHIPISISIASNVAGYEEPTCIVEMNAKSLISKMMTRLLEISNTSYNILKDKYSSLNAELDELIERYQGNQSNDSYFKSDECLLQSQAEERGSNPFINLKHEFNNYLKQIPVIGFNSGKYDLNLIKNQIMAYITCRYEQNEIFTFKKNNTYISNLLVYPK